MNITITKLTLALLSAAFVSAPAFAQPAQHSTSRSEKTRKNYDPAKRAERMSKMLGLSAEQQSQITTILTEAKSQHDALRADGRSAENRKKARELRQSTDAKISAILTDEQRTQWTAAKDKRRNRMQEGRGRKTKPEAPANAA